MVELIVTTVVSVYVERLRECVVNQVSSAYRTAIIRSNPGVTRSIIVSRAGRSAFVAFVGGSITVSLRPRVFGFLFGFLIEA